MIVAIDYDRTFNSDPDLWSRVISVIRECGYEVVCITGRREPPGEHEPPLPEGVEVICAPDSYKAIAAADAGLNINIWIDDMPGYIEPPRRLQWEK